MPIGIKKNHESFSKEVVKLTGQEYLFLEEYKKSSVKIKVLHEACGYEYEVRPADFLKGRRCPKCAGKVRKDTAYFKNEVELLVGDEYEVVGEYKKSSEPVMMRHSTCGRISRIRPNDFLMDVRCAACHFESRRLTQEQFDEKVYQILGSSYKVVGGFKNTKVKIEILHKECGRSFLMRPDIALRGSGCPQCRESKGEKIIESVLKDGFYTYKKQYKIDDCRNVYALPFDFAIFYENALFCLIEFNGEQHYKSIKNWGGVETFNKQKFRDSIKAKYCEAKGIPLIVIPFYASDAGSLLKQELDNIYKEKNISFEQLSIL